MLDKLKEFWKSRSKAQKTQIITTLLTVVYAALVKSGWTPASDTWRMVVELVLSTIA